MSKNSDDVIVLWEAPKIVPPEFRVYYDKGTGQVLFYTGSNFPTTGDYIVIDAITFAAGRPDIRILNGKISTVQAHSVVSKLMPIGEEGQLCAKEDISIVVDESYLGKKTNWKMVIYEI